MRKVTWLKTFLALVILSLSTTSTILAGGILTNTNLSARYARLLALEASISVDAAYIILQEQLNCPKDFTLLLPIKLFFKRELLRLLLHQ